MKFIAMSSISRSSSSLSAEDIFSALLVSCREEGADSWLSDGESYPAYPDIFTKEGKPRQSDCPIKWDRPRAWMPADAYSILPKEVQGASQDDMIPSMWEYNPRCLPKELTGLDLDSFLVDPTKRNLCFLPQDILNKICMKLIPLDFVNLSTTCRYLHWRMYSFTTCHAPYTVQVKIRDKKLSGNYRVEPETYIYNLDEEGRGELSRVSRRYLHEQIGRRGVFLFQPSCLKKPFFFEKLEVTLHLPKYEKDDIDRCLSAILPMRQFVKDLSVILLWDILEDTEIYDEDENVLRYTDRAEYLTSFIDYSAINEFFKMDRVGVDLMYKDKRQTIFHNRIGYYVHPTNATVLRTLNEWRFGTAHLDSLDFHSYHTIQFDAVEDKYPLLDYLYSRCQLEEVEEYYVDCWGHMWKMWLPAEDGRRRLRVVISRPLRFQFIYGSDRRYSPVAYRSFMDLNPNFWSVFIGREEVFDQRFAEMYGDQTNKRKWKMETAIEAEETIEVTGRTEKTEPIEETALIEERERRQSQGEDSPRRVKTYDSPTLSFLAKIVEKKAAITSQQSDGRPDWNPNF